MTLSVIKGIISLDVLANEAQYLYQRGEGESIPANPGHPKSQTITRIGGDYVMILKRANGAIYCSEVLRNWSTESAKLPPNRQMVETAKRYYDHSLRSQFMQSKNFEKVCPFALLFNPGDMRLHIFATQHWRKVL